MKKVFSLNHDWRFKKIADLSQTVLKDDFYMFEAETKTGMQSDYRGNSYYDGEWQLVKLPHDWEMYEAPAGENEMGHGFRPKGAVMYRKTFSLKEWQLGKRLFLKFDAIAMKSIIYINGIKMAKGDSGYIPVMAEITDFVEPGKQITVAVMADSRPKEGWWYEGGGIYGNAYLIAAEDSFFVEDGIYVKPEYLQDGKWQVTVSAEVDCAHNGLRMECIFTETQEKVSVPCEGGRCTASFLVQTPELWCPENPRLYKMKCTLYDQQEALDEEEIAFGFRTIIFDTEKGCLLNGKPIKLKGVCIHHDHAGVGVAMPDKVQRYRIARLKEMGCNAIRTSHNPHLKEFYQACDELGILVMNETRHFSSTTEALEQLRKFVRRDRNHPCVVMWSLFNEEPLQCTKVGLRMAEKMKAVVREEDPTRPVTGGMNGALEKEGVVDCVDIMGINYMQYAYEEFHRLHPRMPIIGSETGSYLTSRYRMYTDLELEKKSCSFTKIAGDNLHPWSASPGQTWKRIMDHDYVLGGFYWTGFDYRSETRGWPAINCDFGAMDMCGFPKDCYYMHKAVWSEVHTIHAVYYRNYKKPGDMIINCYTDCEQFNLYIDDMLFGTFDNDKYDHEPVYIENFNGKEFILTGIERGEEVCTYKEALPVKPYHICAKVSQETLMSNGEDTCVVDVYLKGANDAVVHTANNLVQFQVTGGGRIIGVGNGDSTDHSSEKADTRNLYAGCCQLIVQSNGRKEDTQIQISCEGVRDTALQLRCEDVPMPPFIPSESARISVLSWQASDVYQEYPCNEKIGNMRSSWIPTTVGYGKSLMYSGKKGFGAIVGRIVVPKITNGSRAYLIFEEIQGCVDIYFDKKRVYISHKNCRNVQIPICTENSSIFVTVVFRLDGNDCGICGKVYVEIK